MLDLEWTDWYKRGITNSNRRGYGMDTYRVTMSIQQAGDSQWRGHTHLPTFEFDASMHGLRDSSAAVALATKMINQINPDAIIGSVSAIRIIRKGQ